MQRFKKIFLWIAITLGAVTTILLIVNAWFVATSDSQLEDRLAEIRAAGDPLSLAELAREPISAEKNAATYLRRARSDSDAVQKELDDLGFFSQEHPLPSAADQDAIRAAFKAYPNLIPLLEQAAAAPDYDLQLDYTAAPDRYLEQLMEQTANPRTVARVLCARAAWLTAAGQRDEAVSTSILLLRLTRHWDHSPMIIGYLVSIATRGMAMGMANTTLQAGPVSAETRRALDAELGRYEPTKSFHNMLKGERAFGISSFQSFPSRNFWLVSRGLWNRQELSYLDAVDTFLALNPGETPYQNYQEALETEQQAESRSRWATFGQLILPALSAAYDAVTRTQANVRCLRVLNALQAGTPTGAQPVPRLSDLGLAPTTIIDPYDGQPLRVKRLAEGWLVYSVGRNLHDDGGKVDDTSDVGFGPLPPVAKPQAK